MLETGYTRTCCLAIPREFADGFARGITGRFLEGTRAANGAVNTFYTVRSRQTVRPLHLQPKPR